MNLVGQLIVILDCYQLYVTVMSPIGQLSALWESYQSCLAAMNLIRQWSTWSIGQLSTVTKKTIFNVTFGASFFNKILCWLFTKKHLKFVQFRNLELILKHQGIITVSLNIQLISDCWAGYTFKILKSINITIILFLSGLKKRTET